VTLIDTEKAKSAIAAELEGRYAQMAERDKRIAKMRSGEFICTECLLRKNAEVPQADF
jgi:hypothetical protein